MLNVEYRDEGWMEDRDAFYWRVRFGRDGKYLGIALGIIEGRSTFRAPATEPELFQWFNAGPRVVVDRLVGEARNGTLRTEWEIEAETFVLSPEELAAAANDQVDPYRPGDILAEVEI